MTQNTITDDDIRLFLTVYVLVYHLALLYILLTIDFDNCYDTTHAITSPDKNDDRDFYHISGKSYEGEDRDTLHIAQYADLPID